MRLKLSEINVEKVVKLPRNPINRNILNLKSKTLLERKPKKKHPSKLTNITLKG